MAGLSFRGRLALDCQVQLSVAVYVTLPRHGGAAVPRASRPRRGTRGKDHGQDAHATAGDHRVLLIFLSAPWRLCVKLSLLSSAPKPSRAPRKIRLDTEVRFDLGYKRLFYVFSRETGGISGRKRTAARSGKENT